MWNDFRVHGHIDCFVGVRMQQALSLIFIRTLLSARVNAHIQQLVLADIPAARGVNASHTVGMQQLRNLALDFLSRLPSPRVR